MLKETYDIGGMHCAACAAAIERVTKKLDGVRSSNVNLVMNRLIIEYDDTKVSDEQIIQKIEKAGFTATHHLATNTETHPAQPHADLRQRIILLLLAFVDFLLAMSPTFGLKIPTIPLIFSEWTITTAALFIGKSFFTNGYRALFHANPNMDTLVALSASASYLYSCTIMLLQCFDMALSHPLYFESAAMVVALVSLGKYLEARSSNKTKDALTGLRALSPDTALRIQNGETQQIKVSEIQIGDLIKIQTGMSAPVDGTVIEGSGFMNESMMTGESKPVKKSAGDTVLGATIAIDGAITIRADKIGSDTVFAKIIKFVEDAQGQKAPIARYVDQVSRIFVPAVLFIATIAAAAWLLSGSTLAFALNIFTSVLIIACPCALGLATPTAIIVGTGLAATHGILIRSGAALENTHLIHTVVFDKTGTLTQGNADVTDIVADDAKKCIQYAASLEANISHPIAHAITQYAEKQHIDPIPISDFHAIKGKGVSASSASGNHILLGNAKLMAEHNIDISKLNHELEQMRADAKTPVCLAVDQTLIGVIAIADPIKSDSSKAVSMLHQLGIHTVMLTGDDPVTAKTIADQIGIHDVHAGILPTQKAEIIQSIQQKHKVMMVGDGINDAPALTQADIGCAIGNGSDIAIDSAQIILMNPNLTDVPWAIRLSRKTMAKIKQNLFWAFIYNTLSIPIAAGLLYPAFGILLVPMICAAAMCMSSLFVVTNALSLKRFK